MKKSELRQMIREMLKEELLKENTINEPIMYQMDLEAYLHGTDKYYTDTDNQAQVQCIYQYTGTLATIIAKLNRLVKKYDITMLYIYKAGTDDCVFSADSIDVEEDELYGDTVTHVFYNECIDESEPFMQQFIIDSKCKYNEAITEAVSTKKHYVLATKEKPRINERVFVYLDGNYDYRLGTLMDLSLGDYKDSLKDARYEASLALDTIMVHRLYILQANNLKCVDSFDYMEED